MVVKKGKTKYPSPNHVWGDIKRLLDATSN